MYSGTQFAALADRYGYIVIYPSVTRSSKCFDVSSPQALRRDGGSDPVGIKSMVDYVRQRYPVDPQPDLRHRHLVRRDDDQRPARRLPGRVRAPARPSPGCPFGCFATTNGSEWNSECANGQIIKTPQQWGDLVRNAYPGYTGPRPRMQIWHGTNDETLRYPNFGEQIKQWTNVHGLSQTPDVHRHPAVRLHPHPLRRQRRHRAGRGDQHAGRLAQPAGRRGPGDPLLRPGRPRRRPRPPPDHPAPDHPAAHHAPADDASAHHAAAARRRRRSGACRVGYAVNAWNNGLTAAVTITNTCTAAVNGWTLALHAARRPDHHQRLERHVQPRPAAR